jgi:hypothetical protein
MVMKREPNFIIIGAQKSGTTWLVDMLKLHPQIFIDREEVHYYDNNYHKGNEWYLSHFENANDDQIIGEKTPDYFGLSFRVSKLIHNDLPDVKLVLVLRNPLERAISAYNHYVRMGKISPLKSINKYFKNALEGKDYLDILKYSDYKENLEDFKKYFNESQLFITTYENMMSNKAITLKQLESFLNVNHFHNYKIDLKSNAFNKSFLSLLSNYYLPILNPLFKRLDKYFPNYKQKPNNEIRRDLTNYLKASINIHKEL